MKLVACACRCLLWTLLSITLLPPAWAQSGELVVVVAASSKAPAKISAEEASAIFMGTAKAFPNGEKAVPVDQKAGGEAYAAFYKKAASKSESQMKAYWSRIMFTGKGQPPQEVGDGAAVRKLVADNPNMVGYIEPALVNASVRVIAEIK